MESRMFVSFDFLVIRIAMLVFLLATTLPVLANAGENVLDTVRAGKQVSFEFILTLEDQILINTNVGGEPLTYIHGLQQIMPGLENGLKGMKVLEAKRLSCSQKTVMA